MREVAFSCIRVVKFGFSSEEFGITSIKLETVKSIFFSELLQIVCKFLEGLRICKVEGYTFAAPPVYDTFFSRIFVAFKKQRFLAWP